jgi:hypothetical protein
LSKSRPALFTVLGNTIVEVQDIPGKGLLGFLRVDVVLAR